MLSRMSEVNRERCRYLAMLTTLEKNFGRAIGCILKKKGGIHIGVSELFESLDDDLLAHGCWKS